VSWGHDQLLVGRDDEDLYLGVVGGDAGFALRVIDAAFLSLSTLMPMYSRPWVALARMIGPRSPTPAVKTTASMPPTAAA